MPSPSTEQSGFWMNVKEIAVLLLIVFLIRTFGFGLYQVPTGSMETTMLVGERFFADKLTPYFKSIQHGEIIAFNDPVWPHYSKNPLKRIFQEYIWGPSNWTKRVIGVPGDLVEGRIENGKPVVYLNGKKLDEPYINKYPLVQVRKYDKLEFNRRLRRGEHPATLFTAPKSWAPEATSELTQPFYRIKKDRIAAQSIVYPGQPIPGTPLDPNFGKKEREQGVNYRNKDQFFVKLGPSEYWVMGDNRLGSRDSRSFGPLDGRLIHGRILYRIWSIDSDESWWILDLIKHPIDFWKRVRWGRFFQRVR